VDLTVIDRQIVAFKVRKIDAQASTRATRLLDVLPRQGPLHDAPREHRERPVRPAKVLFDIFDTNGLKMLESTRSTNRIKQVEPFAVEPVTAFLPTHLKPGATRRPTRSTARTRSPGRQHPPVHPPYGTIPGDTGYGIEGLRLRDQLILACLALLVLAGLGWGAYRIVRRRKGGDGGARDRTNR